MADDIIPAIQPGQGSAPQGGYGRGAVDYRSLQNPAQVRTDLPSSGAAERAAALGQVFKTFGGVADEFGSKIGAQQGALAGAASGATGNPNYKEGLNRFSAYNQAFNNAATGAYAIEAEAQADDSAARLRVQANNDPATFQTTYAAVRDAVLKTAPAQAVPMLTELYNKRLANGLAAISGDQQTEIRNTQKATYDEGVQRQISRVATLMGSPNAQDQLSAQDEQVKLSLLIDGGKNSGLYSDAEATAMHISSQRAITGQVFESQFNQALSSDDGGVKAVALLDNFQKAHISNISDKTAIPVLSEPEYQKLYADGITKLREYNLAMSSLRRDGKSAEDLKFEAGDKQYTSMLLSHTLTDKDLDGATRNGDLKPEVARALHNQLLNGPQEAKTSPDVLFHLHTDPNFLNMTDGDLAQYPGLGKKDALDASKEIARRNGSWEGTQSSKQAMGAISAALKIPAGTPSASLSDDERKGLVTAQQDYIQRMNALEPAKRDGMAGQVAQEVIKASQQRSAVSDVTAYTAGKQSFIDRHGPDSNSPINKVDYERKLKFYDDQIKQSQAAAKGQ